jgi:hypothetical protein
MTQIILNSDIGGSFREFYYLVDGQQKTLSRYQAILWAGGDLNRISFYFMDHVWDRIDWPTVPSETFEELCIRRCRQLRDQYDWICIWLSAGYDSQTVLHSFIQSGVRVDEIAYMDREYYPDVEIPFILEAAKNYQTHHNPKLRITRTKIDHDYTFEFYRHHGENWLFQPGANPRFSKSTAAMIQSFNENVVRNRLSTPGRRADIYGKEKPRVWLENDHWYMRAPDRMIEDNIGDVNVNFYLCSEMPELYVKQCHMAIDWFETITDGPITPDHVQGIQWNDRGHYMEWNLACGRVPVACFYSAHAVTKFAFIRATRSPDSLSMINQLRKEEVELLDKWTQPMYQLEYNIKSISGQETYDIDTKVWSKKWPIRPYIHRPAFLL